MCCCSKCKIPCAIMVGLILIGGLNWGLVGLGGFLGSNLNLVNLGLGSIPTAENVVYLLVGLSSVGFALHGLFCKCCKGGEDKGSCCKK